MQKDLEEELAMSSLFIRASSFFDIVKGHVPTIERVPSLMKG
jgi:hypothetical protein